MCTRSCRLIASFLLNVCTRDRLSVPPNCQPYFSLSLCWHGKCEIKMITRRCNLLLQRHHPLGVRYQSYPSPPHGAQPAQHGPPPPPPAFGKSPPVVDVPAPSASSSVGSKASPSATAPSTPYQLELQQYLNQLRWFYQSRLRAAQQTPLSAQSPQTPRRHRRNGVAFSAATLFMIPYLIVEDWLGHIYAMRTQQRLRELRDQTTKCKTIEVKRVPTMFTPSSGGK